MASSIQINYLQKEKLHKGSVYKTVHHNNNIYTTGADGFVLKWSANLKQCELLCKTNTANYTLFIKENLLLIGSSNGLLTIIDHQQKQLVLQLELSKKGIFAIDSYKQSILVGTEEGTLFCFDEQFQLQTKHIISQKSIRGIAQNGENQIALATSDQSIYLLQELNANQTIDVHSNSVFAVKFLNNNTILSGGRDAKLVQTNISTGNSTVIDAHLSTINDIVISPCGNFIATASRDKSLKLWNAQTLKLLKVIHHQKEKQLAPFSINSIAWIEDKIYTVDDSGAVILWQVSNI